MDRKALVAIILSAIILFLYPYFLKRYIYKPGAPLKAAPAALSKPAVPLPGMAAGAAEGAAGVEAAKEELITVDTPLFRAVFTTIGGAIKSFELKNYRETMEKNSPIVNLSGNVFAGPALRSYVETKGTKEEVVFRPSASNISIQEGQSAELVFTGATKAGLRVEKKLVFNGGSYIIHGETSLVNTSAAAFNGGAETLLTAGSVGKDGTGYHVGPLIFTKKRLLREAPKEFEPSGDGVKWLGLENKYFLTVIVPKAEGLSWTSSLSDGSPRVTLQYPVKNLGPGVRTSFNYNIFSGPKEYDLLVKQDSGLEEAIQFGIFSFLAKPFLVVLNFFERYIGNYGIAIILLTFLTKVVFYPLTKHSLTSMRKMQLMQPQMAAIKEKYKDDKEKMNRELMELYKRHRINPLSGCLPMILQIPVFIALYEVLYVSIDLRHAPFFLWIRDLSGRDPYYISPLLMGATMFVQQKMTPTSADPAQAKVMLFMPIIFTYMFLKFPSGLVVYWLVNNLLTIAQQYYIQKVPARA